MDSNIVADGLKRYKAAEEYRLQVEQLTAEITSRYAEDMKSAGFLRQLLLKYRMEQEIQNAMAKLVPPPETLY